MEKVIVEIISLQNYGDHIDEQKQQCKGRIEYHEKGTKLVWNDQKSRYEMILLNNKILLNHDGQKMIFEKDKTTNSVLKTEYGIIDIQIKTNCIQYNQTEKKIHISYCIKIQQIEYTNDIKIKIKENT